MEKSDINANGSVVDLTYLSEISGGDNEFIKNMINKFLVEVTEYLKNMHQLILNKNYKDLKLLAHKFKSCVFIVGVSSVSPFLDYFEFGNLGNEAYEKIVKNYDDMHDVCVRASKELVSLKDKMH
jgi:hypothetical protein